MERRDGMEDGDRVPAERLRLFARGLRTVREQADLEHDELAAYLIQDGFRSRVFRDEMALAEVLRRIETGDARWPFEDFSGGMFQRKHFITLVVQCVDGDEKVLKMLTGAIALDILASALEDLNPPDSLFDLGS